MRRKLITTLVGILVLAFGGLAATLIAGNRPSLGLDLQGGISVTQEPVGAFDPASLDLAVERIRERVDALGVSEPEILRQGNAIVTNLPGVKNQKQAEELVKVTGQVYLRPVQGCSAPAPTTVGSSTTVAGGSTTVVPAGSDAATTVAPSAAPTTTAAGGPSRPLTVPTSAPATTTVTGSTIAATTVVGTTVPGSTPAGTRSSTTAGSDVSTTVPGESTTTVAGGAPTTTLPVISDPTKQQVLPTRDGAQCIVGASGGTGEVFSNDAQARISSTAGWEVTVGLRGGAGENTWNALASQCFNKQGECTSGQLAIELDGIIQSHPNVNTPTFSGDVSITGNFSEKEAKDLARVLKSGSLPVKMEVKATQNVSPTLGKDSLRAAWISGLVGVGLVLLFLALYYRTLGLIAAAGLAVSAALLWAIISFLSKTQGLALSLAGIAGLIVSVGVTVDSYVVFFERLKDEVRSGRTMRNSAQRGFAGAWHTIVIADLVSLIGAVVLWYLTVGAVRGFAFFLGLSTVCDLAVSYFFTRPAVLLLARTKWMAQRKVMGIEPAATEVPR